MVPFLHLNLWSIWHFLDKRNIVRIQLFFLHTLAGCPNTTCWTIHLINYLFLYNKLPHTEWLKTTVYISSVSVGQALKQLWSVVLSSWSSWGCRQNVTQSSEGLTTAGRSFQDGQFTWLTNWCVYVFFNKTHFLLLTLLSLFSLSI